MTLAEQKNFLKARFYLVALQQGDSEAEKAFESCLSLWGDCESRYGNDTYKVDAVFIRYKPLLDAERIKYKMADTTTTRPHTKSSSFRGTKNDSGSIVHSGTDITTRDIGKRDSRGYIYPLGYTGGVDSGYLQNQNTEESAKDIDTIKHGAEQSNQSSIVDSSESDEYDSITYSHLSDTELGARYFVICQQCVFDLIANTWDGSLGIC